VDLGVIKRDQQSNIGIMYRKEFKEKILDILEYHYHGRNFIEDRASEDILDLFQDIYTLSDAYNQEKVSKPCECSHFSECLDIGGCIKKLTLNK
tara:strand:- start:1583 stop:1864 length:282 start_codon:yes stop_codon:yes gene_type:complete